MDPHHNALICHCFGHTVEDLARDLRANGRSTILERILAAKRDEACRCSELNPGGR